MQPGSKRKTTMIRQRLRPLVLSMVAVTGITLGCNGGASSGDGTGGGTGSGGVSATGGASSGSGGSTGGTGGSTSTGKLMAIIRWTTTPGTITVSASSGSLTGGSAVVTSTP